MKNIIVRTLTAIITVVSIMFTNLGNDTNKVYDDQARAWRNAWIMTYTYWDWAHRKLNDHANVTAAFRKEYGGYWFGQYSHGALKMLRDNTNKGE